jgi:hypothetical protein
MTNLIPKQVNFNGDELLAVKDVDTGKIHISINHICNGLGLDARIQRDKLKEHMTLSKGCAICPIPSNGGIQEAFTIELDFLPLWLAGINPSKVNLEIQDKLIEYQLKAKDVLAAAFVQNHPQCIEDLIIMQAQSMKELKAEVKQLKADTSQAKQTVEAIKDTIILQPDNWREELNKMFNKIVIVIGGEQFRDMRKDSYKELESRAGVNLDARLRNLRARMLEASKSKTAINEACKLDVIAEDKKLREIYSKIVQELYIKHVA